MPDDRSGTDQVAPPATRHKVKPYALLAVFGVLIATLFGALATMVTAHSATAGTQPPLTVPGPVGPAAAGGASPAATSTTTAPPVSVTPTPGSSVAPSSTTTTVIDPTGGTRVITIPVPPTQPGHPGSTQPGTNPPSSGGSSSSAPPSSDPSGSQEPTDPTDPTDPSSTEPSEPPAAR